MDDIERLSAYLDGQLSEEEVRALEARLAVEPELAKQLEAFRGVDASLRAPFDKLLTEPVPDRFLRLLDDVDDDAKSLPRAEVIDLADVRARRQAKQAGSLWSSWQARGALAASLVVALVAVAQIRTGGSSEQGIETALNETPSGQSRQLSSGATITPRLSFAAKDGRYCREFALSGQTGIACRMDDGWQIEAKVKTESQPDAASEFATAGGAGAGLDDVYKRLGASDPIDPERERALINKGWK